MYHRFGLLFLAQATRDQLKLKQSECSNGQQDKLSTGALTWVKSVNCGELYQSVIAFPKDPVPRDAVLAVISGDERSQTQGFEQPEAFLFVLGIKVPNC